MKRILAFAALLLASCLTALAQQNDPVGGGAYMNITQGNISSSNVKIGVNWKTGAADPVASLYASSSNLGPNGLNFRNLLDNSAFNIYQRGTTAVSSINTTATYHADRWAGYANTGAASATLTNITSSLPVGFANAEQVQRANSNASLQPIFLVQEIPTSDVIPLQGQNVCVSAYLASGANYSSAGGVITVQVITGTGTDQGLSSLLAATWTGQATTLNSSSQAITTTFTRYAPSAWCFTMPTTATEAAVQFGYTPVGTAGANDWFQITGAQFEQVYATNSANALTGIATPYEQRHLGLETVKVQRYFWQINEANSFFAPAANCTATNTITIAWPTPVQMRATPTSAITVGGWQAVIAGAAAAGLSGQAAGTSNVNSVVITATNTCTAGNTVMIRGSGTTGKITATADF